MPVFATEEWMAAYCDEVARHPEADQAAHALDGVYRFVIEPDGPLRERRVHHVRISSNAGAVRVELVDDAQEVRLTMTAKYTRWRQLIQGELDLGLAIMLRRLRISGDLLRLRGEVDNVKPLTESLRRVDTVWLER